ncbi:nitrogen regulatory protein PII-like uncharacterized protein [Xanthomonas arboricola]|nr:nitrogen regulatory protein PII-like uncharacterized protein [Xanthomonas cannabis]
MFHRGADAYALKQAELGMVVGDIFQKMGIAEARFYVWRKEYGGLGPSEFKRLRLRDEENRQLKQLVAELSLDRAMLQEIVKKSSKACPEARMGRPAEGMCWDERASCAANRGDVALGVFL